MSEGYEYANWFHKAHFPGQCENAYGSADWQVHWHEMSDYPLMSEQQILTMRPAQCQILQYK